MFQQLQLKVRQEQLIAILQLVVPDLQNVPLTSSQSGEQVGVGHGEHE